MRVAVVTDKDLVDARSFSRRRLVTAFLSGAPGGREVELQRPGRTILGGLALSVLLIAGAAIASVLAPRTPEDWNRVGLVVTRGDQPAPYVILDEEESPTLAPVINITSAQLMLGADVKATFVDQEVVDGQRVGSPIGILGAPQTLPQSQQLNVGRWTACTDDGVGTKVDISREQRVTPTDSAAVVVESAGRQWLLATSGGEDRDRATLRYPIAPTESDDLLLGFGLDQKSQAIRVPEEWLGLLPQGGEIGPGGFGVTGFGEVLRGGPAHGARVGDYAVSPSGQAGMFFAGGVQPLDDFALAVLQNARHRQRPPVRLEVELPANFDDITYDISRWPTTAVGPLASPPCVQLQVAPGHRPRVTLASSPRGAAVAPGADSKEQIPPGERRVTVDRGYGAFVMSGSWEESESDTTFVIDQLGTSYALVGGAVTLDRLGYDKDDAPLVPNEWLGLLDAGVALSTSAASCPPSTTAEEQPQRHGCRDLG